MIIYIALAVVTALAILSTRTLWHILHLLSYERVALIVWHLETPSVLYSRLGYWERWLFSRLILFITSRFHPSWVRDRDARLQLARERNP